MCIVVVQVEWPVKLHIAQGVIHGMNYLHTKTPPVVHGDLKVQNVLIGDGFKAKVSAVFLYANSDLQHYCFVVSLQWKVT